MTKTMKPLDQKLAVTGVAVVATEEMLACQLRLHTVDEMRDNIVRSAYWPDFVRMANNGQIPENWLGDGALGRVVLAWAKKGGAK
jgi:hypothetical protein